MRPRLLISYGYYWGILTQEPFLSAPAILQLSTFSLSINLQLLFGNLAANRGNNEHSWHTLGLTLVIMPKKTFDFLYTYPTKWTVGLDGPACLVSKFLEYVTYYFTRYERIENQRGGLFSYILVVIGDFEVFWPHCNGFRRSMSPLNFFGGNEPPKLALGATIRQSRQQLFCTKGRGQSTRN